MEQLKPAQSKYIRETTKKATVKNISILFIISYFLIPQYVGIDVAGFDLTVNRAFLVILFICIFSDPDRSKQFTRMVRQFKYLSPIVFFVFVLLYTGGLRADINTMMNATIEFAFMFLIVYILKFEMSLELFSKLVCGCGYVLCILGIEEYVTHVNLFHKLQTLDANFSQFIRSGNLRIMGPCGHALAYGLLLLIIVPFACVDWKSKQINILQNKVLFLLLAVNVILTGSRSSLALFALEVVLLFLFSPMKEKKVALLFVGVALVCVAAFVIVLPNNGMSRYIMLQVTSVLDTILGTSMAVSYGAEMERLDNSTYYRQVLPKVFFVPYLNPILGRGVSRHSSFQIDGISIISIDNFYVAQYIRYAYTGLISYMWFVVASWIDMFKYWLKKKEGIIIAFAVAILCYYINLWWMDALQTLRYIYAVIAVAYVYIEADLPQLAKKKRGTINESKYIRRRI